MKTLQPYHLVQPSPWPITGSIGAMALTFSTAHWFHINKLTILPISLFIVALTMALWWRDIIRESTMGGFHTVKVQRGMEWGMLLFITSEVMFFSAFFWAFFHSSLSPTWEIGCSWPPTGIIPLNPMSVPLLNTAILLASGVSVTWAHHDFYINLICELSWSLSFTVFLGLYFTYLQAMEYYEAMFNLSDSVYGACFFIATGFHGLHVIIGTTFLSIVLWRVRLRHFSKDRHFAFEAAAWYWHFVDVVWIFLFISIYWWG